MSYVMNGSRAGRPFGRSCCLLALGLAWSACGDDVQVIPDAGLPDAGQADAALPVDAAAPADAGPYEPPVVDFPAPGDMRPFYLSELELFLSVEDEVLASDLIAFEPRHVLWSDSADKRRWLRLPADGQIDTSDPDRWQFPVGTVAFKEFVRDGVRVETRVIARTGTGPWDYWMGAFIWLPDGSDALFAVDGQENARGTDHDVPGFDDCVACHGGEPGRILGMSYVQMASSTRDALLARDALAPAPPGDADHDLPGETPEELVERQALGYLHANCGHCHNELGTARPDTDMVLRLHADESSIDANALYQSTVDVPALIGNGAEYRIAAGSPQDSVVMQRMQTRGSLAQMPPLGTELVDDQGVDTVRAWIETLAQAQATW